MGRMMVLAELAEVLYLKSRKKYRIVEIYRKGLAYLILLGAKEGLLMRLEVRFCLSLAIFITVVLGLIFPKITGAAIQQNIVILNSYHKEFTWSDEQTEGMIQGLRSLGADPIFHVEYMDWKYGPTEENLRLRYEQYKLRYANRKIDLVMTTDDAALQFAIKYRQELFSNAPIVFTGVMEGPAKKIMAGQSDITGVYEKFDAEGTIRLMYKLNPSLQRIYLAYDNTESGLQTLGPMEEAAYKVNPNFQLIHLNLLTFGDIMKTLSMIPKNDNSAVLINTYSRDIEGTTMEMERYVKLFSESSNVPSYILYYFDNGSGAVGGSLIEGKRQGQAAAKLAIRILSGDKASAIPIVESTVSDIVLDYRQLERYNIPLDKLPSDATVFNRPQSFYEQYKVAVWTATGIFAIMSCFILILMVNIRRRQVAENEIRNSNMELSALYEEIMASQEELQQKYEELSNMQEALRESEIQYRSLVDNVNIGVYRNNGDNGGRFIQANPAMANIFGYDSVEAFLEVPVKEIYRNGEDRVSFLDDLIRSGIIKDKELAMRKKDGTFIWCSCTSTVQYDDAGNFKWIDAVLEDITERKRVSEALRQAHDELEAKVEKRTQELASANQELIVMNKELITVNNEVQKVNTELQREIVERQQVEARLANTNQELIQAIENLKKMQEYVIQSEKMAALGNLVAGVAHEINTPVGVGVTAASHLQQITKEFLNLCANGTLNRRELAYYLETIEESSVIILRNLERAGRLIHSFKQVSVDQSNEIQREFNVSKYLGEILLSVNPSIKKTNQHITVECSNEISIYGFAGAFAQIVTNLIMNSLTHAYAPEDEGEIKITIGEEKGDVIFTYSDDGKGMESNVLTRIFDPFFTTKRGMGGTGLGLYIVYNIVTQQFKGTIKCNSILGEGTTVEIRMPIKGAN